MISALWPARSASTVSSLGPHPMALAISMIPTARDSARVAPRCATSLQRKPWTSALISAGLPVILTSKSIVKNRTSTAAASNSSWSNPSIHRATGGPDVQFRRENRIAPIKLLSAVALPQPASSALLPDKSVSQSRSQICKSAVGSHLSHLNV